MGMLYNGLSGTSVDINGMVATDSGRHYEKTGTTRIGTFPASILKATGTEVAWISVLSFKVGFINTAEDSARFTARFTSSVSSRSYQARILRNGTQVAISDSDDWWANKVEIFDLDPFLKGDTIELQINKVSGGTTTNVTTDLIGLYGTETDTKPSIIPINIVEG